MERDGTPSAPDQDAAEATRIATAWRLLVERRRRAQPAAFARPAATAPSVATRAGAGPATSPTSGLSASPPPTAEHKGDPAEAGESGPSTEVQGEAVARWQADVDEVARLAGQLADGATAAPVDPDASRRAAWRLARAWEPTSEAAAVAPASTAPAAALPRRQWTWRILAASFLLGTGIFVLGVAVGIHLGQETAPIPVGTVETVPAPSLSEPTGASPTPGSTPTAPPSPTAAGSAVVGTIRVVTSPTGLRVRAAPDPTARILGSVPKGARLRVLAVSDANGGWYQVEGPGGTGWVSADPSLTAPAG